jgi:hypothetical protein
MQHLTRPPLALPRPVADVAAHDCGKSQTVASHVRQLTPKSSSGHPESGRDPRHAAREWVHSNPDRRHAGKAERSFVRR